MDGEEEIFKKLEKLIKEKGAKYVGNNFNKWFSSESIDKFLSKETKEKKTARQKKSFLDVKRGKLFEQITIKLLNSTFQYEKGYEHIKASAPIKGSCPNYILQALDKIKLTRVRTNFYKKPDVDAVIYSILPKFKNRLFLLSVKGTARERIGQFLSNLFIFDEDIVNKKYPNLYILSWVDSENPIDFKIGFVCYDLAKHRDLSGENLTKKIKKSTKQTEVYLIDDDQKVSGGIYVFNNLPKLKKVGNFTSLVGKIEEFFT